MKISPHDTPHRSPRALGALLAIPLLAALPCAAQTVTSAHVTARLITEVEAIVPGRPFYVALRLEMEKGWHTYWKNPGDAGLATTIEWELPEGFAAGPILWPRPFLLGEPPEVSYGFDDLVVLPVVITPPASLRAGDSITLRARAGWLACKEMCVAGKANLALTLPVAEAGTGAAGTGTGGGAAFRWSGEFGGAFARIPKSPSGMTIEAGRSGDGYVLHVIPGAEGFAYPPGSAIFYAAEEGVIDHSGRQIVVSDAGSLRLTLPASPYATGPATRLRGVLVIGRSEAAASAIEIDVPVADTGG